ncbi:MAG TPA: HD domain-containing protein [Ktedonobacteraceae bacterium]|nr:HD domain-containing protein [Ktedonobacteraceae bacterium]
MDTGVVTSVAQYAESVLGKERFRYISAVVANCKMLALELEAGEEEEEKSDAPETIDVEALIMAAYLHDISTVAHGFQEHCLKSAAMAVEFLRGLDVPAERIDTVEQAILAHTTAYASEEQEIAPVEGRILYDADKLGRLSGLAVVTSLIEFGARYPDRAVTGDVLAAILRHVEERFVELYQSLYTAPAREMAQVKFGNTLAFLDGVIEHLAESTPV